MKKNEFVEALKDVSRIVSRVEDFMRGMGFARGGNNYAGIYAVDLSNAENILYNLIKEIGSVSDREVEEAKKVKSEKVSKGASRRRKVSKGISRLRGDELKEVLDRSSELIFIAFKGFSVSTPELRRFLKEKGLFNTVKSGAGQIERVYAVMDVLVKEGKAVYHGKKGKSKQWSILKPQKKYSYRHFYRSPVDKGDD